MFENITSATFTGILDEIKTLIPIVLPAVVGFLAFRKGWYQLETADENKIENAYNKYSKCLKEFYEKK